MRWFLAIIIIGLLVFIHELGHFLIARINGVEVEEFSLGFGPRLISRQIGRTRYSLKVLPLGGSCLMKGMDYDEEDDEESGETVSRDDLAGTAAEEGSYRAASPGRRAAILLAGPFFNFLLAFAAAVIVISAVGFDPARVLTVESGSPAEEAGLREGDTITAINGRKVVIGRDVNAFFTFETLKEGDTLILQVERDGQTQSVAFQPENVTVCRMGITYDAGADAVRVSAVTEGSPLDEAGVRAGDVLTAIDGTPLGTAEELSAYLDDHPLTERPVRVTCLRDGEIFEVSVTPIPVTYLDTGFDYNMGRVKTDAPGVIRYSFYEVKFWIGMTVDSLKMLLTGQASINDLSGPVGIADIVGTTYEESRSEGVLMTFLSLLNLVILLSANLGVMNLLPIPGLDGGKLLFVIIEGVSGRPVNRRFENTIQLVAAALLMMLMVYVMYHDVMRLLT